MHAMWLDTLTMSEEHPLSHSAFCLTLIDPEGKLTFLKDSVQTDLSHAQLQQTWATRRGVVRDAEDKVVTSFWPGNSEH